MAPRCIALAALTLALAGCLGPATFDCGNGFLCPAGERCLLGPGGQTCILATCGNGHVDPGEVCDDGNNVSGDGCPADCGPACGDGFHDPGEICDPGDPAQARTCTSDCHLVAACGNGILDPGESCDTGDLQSHDGCSSRCTTETFGWTVRDSGTPAAGPGAMTYHAPLGTLVLLDTAHQTWTWDRGGWHLHHVADTPPYVTEGAGMAYNALELQDVVLFGHFDDPFDTYWVWNGAAWDEFGAGGSAHPALVRYGVACDAARSYVVVLGATADGEEQTWEFYTMWRQIPAPLARTGVPAAASPSHAMTYDGRRERVVLYRADGLWDYDGIDWILRPGTAGPVSDDIAIVYDPARDRVVLFGAFDRGGAARVAETWEWDNTQWQRVASDGPAVRTQMVMSYDVVAGAAVLFGGKRDGVPDGTPDGPGTGLDDTWTWDGTAWRQAIPAAPAARSHHAMIDDTRRASAMLFGGLDAAGQRLGDTWLWDGAAWDQPALSTSPPARADHALAYNAGSGVTVLFGGDGDAGPLDDTWEWGGNGPAWTVRTPDIRPPARSGHAMVYNAHRGTTELFGGAAGGAVLGDQWAWDGAAWTQLQPAAQPPARRDTAMVFDPARNKVVLFGGQGAAGLIGDTWEWDGQWTDRTPGVPLSPSPRAGHTMIYDDTLRRVTLVGGRDASGALSDVWTWNGFAGTWQELPAPAPPPRDHTAMVSDPARETMLMFGGAGATGALGDLWLLRSADPAVPDEVCTTGLDADRDGKAGCADPDCAALCQTCGDRVCESFENCRECPIDCGDCSVCGDLICDAGESCMTCPGDCGRCR